MSLHLFSPFDVMHSARCKFLLFLPCCLFMVSHDVLWQLPILPDSERTPTLVPASTLEAALDVVCAQVMDLSPT
jgi:hypothetical protein